MLKIKTKVIPLWTSKKHQIGNNFNIFMRIIFRNIELADRLEVNLPDSEHLNRSL